MEKLNYPIGGYFGLELNKSIGYHKNAIALNTARNALEYVLIAKKYQKVYIPYFTCDVILEPFQKLNIAYEFYKIDENFEPIFDFEKILENQAFLYTNYFALKDKFIKFLAEKTCNLIIDNAQSFFSKPLRGLDTFYSPRKFFGVPDGAYLYSDTKLGQDLKTDKSITRFSHLLKRIDNSAEEGYLDFINNDKSLENNPIKKMSSLTSELLASINYESIVAIRKKNMAYLHFSLSASNKLKFDTKKIGVPMVYPLLTKDGNSLRKHLINNKIFTARYWPNVTNWAKKDSFEYFLAENLIALPIDQRYTENDMKIILNTINDY